MPAAASSAPAARPASDPPYAWVMLPLAVLMHVGTSPGQTFGVSLFNEPIRRSLDLSHTQLTGAYLVASLLAAVPMMWVGRRMDRHGLKRVSLALVVGVALACVAISRVEGLVGLTACFFALRTLGQGALSLAAGNTLGMWFSKRLGLASGIAGVGMSASIAVMPLVYLRLIESLGWRDAYATVGFALLATLLPLLAIAYRDNDETDDQTDPSLPAARPSLTLHQALRTPAYWVASASTALVGLVCTAVFFNLVPLLELNGLTAAQAAGVFPAVAVAMALMQLVGGFLADHTPLRVLMAVSVATLGAGVVVLGYGASLATVVGGGVLIGAGQGLMAVTGNTLWPRYFGRAELGAIRSSVWTATVAACSAGPFVMGVTLDVTGGYGPSLWLFVVLAAIASGASLIAGAPPESVAVRRGADPMPAA